MKIEKINPEELTAYKNNARTHSKKQIEQIARSIDRFGFINPIIIDPSNTIVAGHGRWLAAKELKLENIPVIRIDHLHKGDWNSYIIADNKLAQKAGWDKEILKLEFENLIQIDPNIDLTLTGFDIPEIDLILNLDVPDNKDSLDLIPDKSAIQKRVQSGDLWQLGQHFLYCGDSLNPQSLEILMQDTKADLVFTDPPYNVPIEDNVSGKGKVKHKDFFFASGEMSQAGFIEFLEKSFKNLTQYSKEGSLHYVCMDWRHVYEIQTAANKIYTEHKNICVWNKQLAGMGSLYRSQHELIFVFKHGKAPHLNNIALGRHGRNRTNIWDYPGIHISNTNKDLLKLHPTVKPISMIADAIVDCSAIGDIVLDIFGGSGSTLLAAERVKRKCRMIEYEPKYCDVILTRFEKLTKTKAKKVESHVKQ